MSTGDGWLLPAACVGVGLLAGYCCSVQRQHPPPAAAAVTSHLPHHAPTLTKKSIALITGVSPGTMGEGIALEFAALGCSIVAVEHPSRISLCKDSCAMLERKYGVKAVALSADATNQEQVEASFQAAKAAFDGVAPNIVVSTVGGGGVAPDGKPRNQGTNPDGSANVSGAHNEPMETTMRILAVTQLSQHYCCKAAARHMIASGTGGSILMIGSIMASLGFCAPTSSTYSSSKSAIKKLGEIMARELAPSNIRVNILQPGHMLTRVEAESIAAGNYTEESMNKRIPIGRMGSPADVGKAAAFLCSESASYITGATLDVDEEEQAALTKYGAILKEARTAIDSGSA